VCPVRYGRTYRTYVNFNFAILVMRIVIQIMLLGYIPLADIEMRDLSL
jgi:hypothetical protein